MCVRQSQWYAQCREASPPPPSPNRMRLGSTTSLTSTNSAALRERNDIGEEDADSVSVSTSLLSALIAALVLIPAVVISLFCAWRKSCRRAAAREGAQHDKKCGVPSLGAARAVNGTGLVHVTPPGLVSGRTLHDELSVSSHADSVADVENKADFV